MALPDTLKTVPGTPVIWGEAGATGLSLTVTNTLSFDALASAAARAGAEVDLGSSWDQEYSLQLIIETGTAPTAGTTVRLYMACTHSTADDYYAGGATGADASFTAANEPQLGVPDITLVMPNTGNTAIKSNTVLWRPAGRYVVPVVVNGMNQAIRNQGTNSDNLSRVVLTPLALQVVD